MPETTLAQSQRSFIHISLLKTKPSSLAWQPRAAWGDMFDGPNLPWERDVAEIWEKKIGFWKTLLWYWPRNRQRTGQSWVIPNITGRGRCAVRQSSQVGLVWNVHFGVSEILNQDISDILAMVTVMPYYRHFRFWQVALYDSTYTCSFSIA
jgi:hypothetical protein